VPTQTGNSGPCSAPSGKARRVLRCTARAQALSSLSADFVNVPPGGDPALRERGGLLLPPGCSRGPNRREGVTEQPEQGAFPAGRLPAWKPVLRVHVLRCDDRSERVGTAMPVPFPAARWESKILIWAETTRQRAQQWVETI